MTACCRGGYSTPRRRVPKTGIAEYLALARLMWSGKQKTIGDVIDCDGMLYQRLIQPLLLAALNTEPREGSAALAAAVIRETLGSGGRACRPLIARDGLANAFIDPALQVLATRNATVQFGHRLRAMTLAGDQVTALQFGEETIELAASDAVILAVPPVVAASLLPGLETPDEFRAIVNAHFRIAPPKDLSPITGVVNGMVEWLFAFPDRLSITISAADRLLETPRETLAEQIWREVAQIAGLDNALPRWQIVRERRATFAATPSQDAKRPQAKTAYRNLMLAGDWTATGLPATIESAVRSGHKAAQLVGEMTPH